jgi:hypothetical protein
VAGHQFLRLGQRHLGFVLGGTAGAVGQSEELADFIEDVGFGFSGDSRASDQRDRLPPSAWIPQSTGGRLPVRWTVTAVHGISVMWETQK